MSTRTTYFGPRVSLRTTQSDVNADIHFQVPSNATFEIANEHGIKMSGATTASFTSLTLPDQHLSIGSVSATSATIYFRSGVTIYQFDAQAASVL